MKTKMLLMIGLCGFCSVLSVCGAGESPAVISTEFIFDPAPTPECHASTIVETPHGIVAAWFAGTKEKNPDVGIWSARFEAGRWSAPEELIPSSEADGASSAGVREPCWNPVLFQPRSGPLLLFYKAGRDMPYWRGMLTRSNDGGRTWAKPEKLPYGILGPIKNKPVQLANGDLLCPSSDEQIGSGWRVHFERSTDLGKTWTRTAAVNDGHVLAAIQPSILHHADGRLQAIGRTKQRALFTTESRDDGLTWSEATLLEVPNPNSGTDAVTLRDGRHLLVYNHNPEPKGRTPLNVALSDDGINWREVLVLEDEPGEYSYPAVIQAADGRVHLTYTWKRERIKHVVLDPAQL